VIKYLIARPDPVAAWQFWNNLRFPGQIWDYSSQTSYNYFRNLDPKTGRYTQHDLIGLNGGMNPFAYVGGNPITQRDANGLFIDTIADAGFILYDLYRIIADNIVHDCGNINANLTALGADVGGLFIPAATGLGLGVRAVNKADSLKWVKMKPWRGKTKTNGKSGKQKKYYEWDHTHNDIEVYNARGEHLGSMDPTTGKMTKPAVSGRRIKVK